MKTIYFDCGAGVAGDMLVASLLGLMPDPQEFIEKINAIGLEGVTASLSKNESGGIAGFNFNVSVNGVEEESLDYHQGHEHHHHDEAGEDGDGAKHDHHHHHHGEDGEDCDDAEHDHHDHHHAHRSMADISDIVNGLSVSDQVKEKVLRVYSLIAEAESRAHGTEVTEIHFHEVGSMDAIMDITAFSMLMEEIDAEKVLASPVRTGYGHVHCAHGVLPVPAPATAFLLEGIPSYAGDIRGEMSTPTGVALLKAFAEGFGPQPAMVTEGVGYGLGHKSFPIANILRAFLGQSESQGKIAAAENPEAPTILELSCNIDDMTGEEIGFALEVIMGSGAVDVFTTPIGMKKSRPGTMITALCKEDKKDCVISAMFKNTTTLGIRESFKTRYELDRLISGGDDGPSLKSAEGYGVRREKYEYEELANYARDKGLSLFEAKEELKKKNE